MSISLRHILPVLGLAALGLTARPAHAQFFTNTTGITSPNTTITFSEVPLPQNTPLTTQYAAFGVTFSGLFYNPQPGFSNGGISPPAAGNFNGVTGATTNPFSVFFTAPQTSAALAFISNPGTSTFEALNGGTVVATASAATNLTGNFYGFQGITFNQIRITAGGGNNSALIDSIQLGSRGPNAVPEPSQTAALGLGLLGLSGLMLKARKRKAVRA